MRRSLSALRSGLALGEGLVAAALTGSATYLTVLTAAAWRAKVSGGATTALTRPPRHRFVVLVPAHDEELGIGATLKSLGQLDYPDDLVAVHVVADNCTDTTADVVRAHDVEVHERVDPEHPGKGPALQWLLTRLRERGDPHDTIVVLDADTIVTPTFLQIMDARLAAGATVVQAYYSVRDPGSSPATAFRAVALAARHYLRPLGRTHLGGSSGLFGNGMVFAAPVLAARSWTDHLTEDIELQLELLLDGTVVDFAPDAVIEAEMPTTLEAARTQHERWERGRLELARRNLPALVGRVVAGGPAGRVAYADAVADQLVPPFSLLAAGTSAWAAAALVGATVTPGPGARRRLALVTAVSLAEAVHVVSALRLADAPPVVYRSLLQTPKMVAWKVRLWLDVAFGRRRVGWVRTARNAEGGPTG